MTYHVLQACREEIEISMLLIICDKLKKQRKVLECDFEVYAIRPSVWDAPSSS